MTALWHAATVGQQYAAAVLAVLTVWLLICLACERVGRNNQDRWTS